MPEANRVRTIATRKQNLAKFGHVVFESCKQTDRQTGILILILHMQSIGEVISLLITIDNATIMIIKTRMIFMVQSTWQATARVQPVHLTMQTEQHGAANP